MALRTNSLVLSWGRDFDFGSLGTPTMTNVMSSLISFAVSGCDFARGILLDSEKLTGTYRSAIRTVGGLSSWGPAEMLIVGDVAGVQVRVTDGVNDYWFYNGAWVAIGQGSGWNAPADLYAALPLYTKKTLGFVVKLSRSTAGVDSPVLMGINAVARVLFIQTAEDLTRASSWQDDALTRVLIAQLLTIRLSGVQEFTTVGGETALSFAAGVAEYPHDVTDIEAVFNRATWSQIPGQFNATTKTWTPESPLPAGIRLHVRYGYRPAVAHTGDSDYFSTSQPEILVESVKEIDLGRPIGTLAVRSLTDRQCVDVPVPTARRYQFGLRMIAAKATERDRLLAAVHQMFDVPRVYISPTTSLAIVIGLIPGSGETGNVIGDGFDERLSLAADTECWHGEESTRATTGVDGFSPVVSHSRS